MHYIGVSEWKASEIDAALSLGQIVWSPGLGASRPDVMARIDEVLEGVVTTDPARTESPAERP